MKLPAVLLACLVSSAVAAVAVYAALAPHRPGDDSVEAGFARDMQVHHAQAVEMATIVRDNTSDPTIRSIAYDILTSQEQQMGQMFAWLRSWDLPQTTGRKPMAWMRSMSHDQVSSMAGMEMGGDNAMSLLPDGRMPGMASASDLARLKSLRGVAAERLFLKLMIAHHKAGVMMAQAAADQSKNEQVDDLARSIARAQQVEIDAMTSLLSERSSSAN